MAATRSRVSGDRVAVDLRSDTVTRPTAAMRRAMAEAEVGDDVYREDPTVRRLEERAAELVGHESALLLPSGTMGNQIAIQLLAPRGTEVLVEAGSHVYLYELAAMAAWAGAQPRVLQGLDGLIEPSQLAGAIHPPVYYEARATLLVLENTHNHGGGTILTPEAQQDLIEEARRLKLAVHLDGARIFNAAVALGRPPAELAAGVDSVMFCLSKGLGAPVGSMLCGGRELIEEARVARKRMGGGMRQAGVLAAAGLVALERVDRLAEDHARARRLAAVLAALPGVTIDPRRVRTNIAIAEVRPAGRLDRWLPELQRRGVLASELGRDRLRLVTHGDVDDGDVEHAASALREVAARI